MIRPLTGIPADRPQSYRSIEEAAIRFRKMIGIGPLDEFDARTCFEVQLGDIELLDQGESIPMVEAVEDCPQEGMTRWDPEAERIEIVLSQERYDMLRDNHVRARSTVSHEIGHAILHTRQIIRLAGLSLTSQVALHRERNPHKAFMDTEWQANAFGSALLMPAKGLWLVRQEQSSLTAKSIASMFRVSEESASYRLNTYEKALWG